MTLFAGGDLKLGQVVRMRAPNALIIFNHHGKEKKMKITIVSVGMFLDQTFLAPAQPFTFLSLQDR